jgi:hypothetical protein
MNQGKISALFKSLISSSKITVLTNGLDLKLSTKNCVVTAYEFNINNYYFFQVLQLLLSFYQSYTPNKGIRGSLIYIFPSF